MSVQKTNSQNAKTNSRILRQRQTKAEQLLWGVIRNRKINSLKFRRQHPYDMYVLDFYCEEKKLVVELDGDSHEEEGDYDCARDAWLGARGLKVVRVNNEDVIDDVDAVANYIARICEGELGW